MQRGFAPKLNEPSVLCFFTTSSAFYSLSLSSLMVSCCYVLVLILLVLSHLFSCDIPPPNFPIQIGYWLGKYIIKLFLKQFSGNIPSLGALTLSSYWLLKCFGTVFSVAKISGICFLSGCFNILLIRHC